MINLGGGGGGDSRELKHESLHDLVWDWMKVGIKSGGEGGSREEGGKLRKGCLSCHGGGAIAVGWPVHGIQFVARR